MSNKIYGYAVVAYPESMPSDWQQKLEVLPFGYCYAKHDKDVNKETGELKKAHIHFYFQGHPTSSQKKVIYESLNIHEYGEDVRSADGMYQYLTHSNYPDKYQYSKDIIRQSTKWNQELFESNLSFEASESELIDFILSNNITEYAGLMVSIVTSGRTTEFMKMAKQPWVYHFIDSLRYGDGQIENTGKQ